MVTARRHLESAYLVRDSPASLPPDLGDYEAWTRRQTDSPRDHPGSRDPNARLSEQERLRGRYRRCHVATSIGAGLARRSSPRATRFASARAMKARMLRRPR